ncbi:MAG: type II toxin-antitoxin system RelE/ParE family toxin [Flavobacterium sp.]|uniref:type II toxin-antitoxin system RelE/ParE family toxin n=1 Tax=Flavobacterium sp. TaxID=239 RepID=UPI003BEC4958
MAKFSFTNRALDDLIEIWDYTVENWSENQAEKYYNLIIASCLDLANNPELGKSYNIVSQNLLGFKCGEHIIFFQEIVKNEIEIARVLHGMMDLKSKI